AERPLERLADGRWAVPRFYQTFPKAGWHYGWVEIDDDSLAMDNRRFFAVEVLKSVKVLAVNGAPSEVPRLDELFFFKAALTAFADPKFANLAGVTFRALWKTDPRDAAVLMRASTGSPLLCEKPFGKGRVLLFTAPCDRDWSNFPVRPAFLPWAHRLVAY